MAMNDARCTDCTRLREAAFDAIVRHFHAENRLAIAKLDNDRPQVTILEPQVEHLLKERRAAVQAYQEHIATHPKKPQAQADLTENSHKKKMNPTPPSRIGSETVMAGRPESICRIAREAAGFANPVKFPAVTRHTGQAGLIRTGFVG
jgi:hypothetical protein